MLGDGLRRTLDVRLAETRPLSMLLALQVKELTVERRAWRRTRSRDPRALV